MRNSPRFETVDALRGAAMVWMTLFHFSFDLNTFNFISQDFYQNPLWTTQRICIVSLFLFCAGMGQAFAQINERSAAQFWRRWLQIAACALVVSVGSWWMFPQSYIYFGILHGVAAMLLIVRLSGRWGNALWFIGGLALLLPQFAPALIAHWPSTQVLNNMPWNVLGMISHKPITEDYVPLLPWLGVMWWGVAAGQWLSRHAAKTMSTPLPAPLRWIAVLGRWPLTYYMLHQPIMIGGLMALQAIGSHG